jgi:hypothetical protein
VEGEKNQSNPADIGGERRDVSEPRSSLSSGTSLAGVPGGAEMLVPVAWRRPEGRCRPVTRRTQRTDIGGTSRAGRRRRVVARWGAPLRSSAERSFGSSAERSLRSSAERSLRLSAETDDVKEETRGVDSVRVRRLASRHLASNVRGGAARNTRFPPKGAPHR